MKASRGIERDALEAAESPDNNNDKEFKANVTFEADNADEAALDYALEYEEGGDQDMETDGEQAAPMITPEPFEPAEQPAALAVQEPRAAAIAAEGGGAVRKSPVYPALDVRKSKREERLKKKAEVEDKIARMVTDSAMKVEVAMEHDRKGKN